VSPLTIFVLILVLVWGSIALLLRNETQRAGGLKAWLVDLPTTNFRIFVSIVLAVFYVVITMLLTVVAAMNPEDVRTLPDVVLDTVGLFLIGMMGIDAASYIAKRLTHKKYADGGDDPPPGSTSQMPAAPGSTTVQTGGAATVTVVQPEQPSGQ
jgi:hypothetical protein